MRNILMANRLREVLLSGKWIANTNFREQIEKVSWQQAVQRVASLNTIAQLTFHINYYLDGVLSVLNGGHLEISDQYSFDMPEVNGEAEWQQLVQSFVRNATLFTEAVAAMPDEKFDQIFEEEKYGTYHRNIDSMIEHAYYHLGQVVIIRKLILTADL